MTHDAPPILITGGRGTLGTAFARMCTLRDLTHVLTMRGDLDIGDPDSVAAALDRYRPWAVINAAGYVRVDDAEHDHDRCMRENAAGAGFLAAACASARIPLVTFSSDLVFDGEKGALYDEHDPPRPLSVYGRSKLAAEERVLDAHPRAMVVRTSAFFGPWDVHNFVTQAIAALRGGRTVRAAHDALVSPTYLPDLVNSCLDLLIDGESGLWHLSNVGAISWADLARTAARLAGVDDRAVEAVPAAAMQWRAQRPSFSALGSRRGALLPALDDALARYLADVGGAPPASSS
jgi:dTDP-4-dehydrorhamnose reductase